MPKIFLVQHGEKQRGPGDPGLTDLGHNDARRTASYLSQFGLTRISSGPLLRARQTAAHLADLAGLEVRIDDRITERMNWDGVGTLVDFLSEWERTVIDRDHVPRIGDSSRRAGERFVEFLRSVAELPGPLAVATHGGVTVDVLRTLLGDARVPESLLTEGIPSCSITVLDDLDVLEIASRRHLMQP